MAANPVFTATPHVEVTNISTANTNRDGSGTISTCFTAGASGSRLDRVIVRATGNTTNGMIRLYLYDGTNYRIFHEVSITGTTPSATVEGASATVILNNFFIPGSSGFNRVGVSTHNAETFNITVMGSDL